MSGHLRRRGERSWELKFDVGNDPLTGQRRIRYASFKGPKLYLRSGHHSTAIPVSARRRAAEVAARRVPKSAHPIVAADN